ncbi:conserved exported hypothetical protein [[Clostridium] ultunense Esp]|nr:conserved exported hypothetical protein [[Clostridium] ultunense Esp]
MNRSQRFINMVFVFIFTATLFPSPIHSQIEGNKEYYRELLKEHDRDVVEPNKEGSLLPRKGKYPVPKGVRKQVEHGSGVNLSIGKTYWVETQWEDPLFKSQEIAFPDENKELTDGEFGGLDWDQGRDPWVGYIRQGGRTITLDLGEQMTVYSFSLDFLQRLDAGITVPEYVQYEVSLDGERWQPIGKVETTTGFWNPDPSTDAFLLEGLYMNARYIRAYFPSMVWQFVDEFTVFGSPIFDPKAPKPIPFPSPPVHEPGYPSPNPHNDKVHQLLLHYVRPDDTLDIPFQPVITYINENGETVDWMYDSILFTPLNVPVTKEGWETWMSTLFESEKQLKRLNDTIEIGKKLLNDPHHKVKVVFSIPYPALSQNSWGELNGENLNFNPIESGQENSYNHRLKAVKWLIDSILERWKQTDYQNLELAGFYWDGETVNMAAQYEKSLIKDTASYIHAKREHLFWIPYYGAPGYINWKEMGFDVVMLQPNYSFANVDVGRLERAAQMAHYYGTGIELEAHWYVSSPNKDLATRYKNRYYDYFTAGNLMKFEYNTVSGWYENTATLQESFANPDPFYREIYDKTYQYIKESWTDTEYRSE